MGPFLHHGHVGIGLLMPFQPAFQQVFSDGLTSGRLKKPVSHADSRFTVLMLPLTIISRIRAVRLLFQPFFLFFLLTQWGYSFPLGQIYPRFYGDIS